MDSADDAREYPCIIRAIDGEEVNISTHVRTYPQSMGDSTA